MTQFSGWEEFNRAMDHLYAEVVQIEWLNNARLPGGSCWTPKEILKRHLENRPSA